MATECITCTVSYGWSFETITLSRMIAEILGLYVKQLAEHIVFVF